MPGSLMLLLLPLKTYFKHYPCKLILFFSTFNVCEYCSITNLEFATCFSLIGIYSLFFFFFNSEVCQMLV